MESDESAGQRRWVPHWFLATLGYIISIVCLIWVYHGFAWKQEIPKVLATDWRWVTIAVIADIGVYVVQAWRWNLVLEPIERVSLLRSVQAIYIGLFANEILPLRSGEVIRSYLQAKWNGLPFSLVVSSVAIERLLDGGWLVLGFYVVVSDMDHVPGYLATGSQILALILVVAGVLLAMAAIHKTHAHKAVSGSRWASALHHVVDGLHAMGRSYSFLIAAIVSLLFLALQVVPVYALARGFGLDLSLGAAVVVLIVLRLGSVPPQAPSNIGTFQFFTIVGLQLFGIVRDDATTFATLLFIVVTVPLWVAGFVAILATRMRLREIHHHARRYLANGSVPGAPDPPAAPPSSTFRPGN